MSVVPPLTLADTNGDGFFDEQELESLFTKEVRPPGGPSENWSVH